MSAFAFQKYQSALYFQEDFNNSTTGLKRGPRSFFQGPDSEIPWLLQSFY